MCEGVCVCSEWTLSVVVIIELYSFRIPVDKHVHSLRIGT